MPDTTLRDLVPKSLDASFAEALEVLHTGDTYRWAQRTTVWRDVWTNLHHPKAAITAEFANQGQLERA